MQAAFMRLRDSVEEDDSAARFAYLAELDPAPDPTPLGDRLRRFAEPYRAEFERLWHEQARECPDSLIELVVDVDALLDSPKAG